MKILHQTTPARGASRGSVLNQPNHLFPSPSRRQKGSALMIALIATGIVAFVLAAYLNLLGSQNTSTMRSQAWNSAIPVIEAGVEDALTHLNAHGATNLFCDNWNQAGGVYWVQRSVGDNYYIVTISNPGGTPVIESRGYVGTPILVSSTEPYFLAAAPTISGSPATLSRGVRISTTRSQLFVKGLVAKDSIDMNGNNITTDSFDSTDANSSSNGLYAVNKRKDHGDVAVNSSILNSLNVGNANIYGTASTGPNGSVSLGTNGVVGDMGWHAAHSGAQPGSIKSDMNVNFPDVQPPWNGGAFTPNGTAGYITNIVVVSNSPAITSIDYPWGASSILTNYPNVSSTYPLGSPGPVSTNFSTNTTFTSSRTFPLAGTYVGGVTIRIVSSGPPADRGTWYDYNGITAINTSYTYPTFTSIYSTYGTNVTFYDYILDAKNYETAAGANFNGRVYVQGDAVLYIPDPSSGVNLTGIDIKPGKSLKFYSGAATVTLGGNDNGLSANFNYYGLPSNTALNIGGNGDFTGTVYAPNADLTMNGGGNNTIDFMGASITKTVKMNGHFNFHYDEALGRTAALGNYVVTSWNEMTPQEVGSLPSGVGTH